MVDNSARPPSRIWPRLDGPAARRARLARLADLTVRYAHSRHNGQQSEALARLRNGDGRLELGATRAAQLWRAESEQRGVAFPRLRSYGGEVSRERREGELRPAEVFLG